MSKPNITMNEVNYSFCSSEMIESNISQQASYAVKGFQADELLQTLDVVNEEKHCAY